MTATRRLHFNFALDRALHWSRELSVPVVVLEAVRLGYPWASARLHTFLVQGMAEQARALRAKGVDYYPYLERRQGDGEGLVEALARSACVVVTDDTPAFFLPRMLDAVSPRLSVRFEAVDSCGLLPLSMADERVFQTAYSFRRFVQRSLEGALSALPSTDPLRALGGRPPECIDPKILARFVPCTERELQKPSELVLGLPFEHHVPPVALAGGERAARARLDDFLKRDLSGYAEDRNHPDRDAGSGLSPWLHFGQLSTHEVFQRLCEQEGFDPLALGQRRGQREGFWGMSASAEAFLDQVITWRELAFNTARLMPRYTELSSLPPWALQTLREHARDERPYRYAPRELEAAATHDELWNAAQRELVHEGRMHNYLRMLWGKKILEWSASPKKALEVMIHLNNKYALDGRDPNSYAGIFWVLGRYDRPWGPKRPVFGSVRYMSSDSARRKLRLKGYLERFGGQAQLSFK